MKARALGLRGFPPLATILIMAAITTGADARIGGPGMSGQTSVGPMTMGPGSNPNMGRGNTPHPPPPVYNGPSRPRGQDVQSDGSSVSFSSGGSGTKPNKKPNLQ